MVCHEKGTGADLKPKLSVRNAGPELNKFHRTPPALWPGVFLFSSIP
jgi:hypothetical protein